VTEDIRCPKCSTRYSLRQERVHGGLSRARCFRCGNEFSVEEAVSRLLGAETGALIPAPKEPMPMAAPELPQTDDFEPDAPSIVAPTDEAGYEASASSPADEAEDNPQAGLSPHEILAQMASSVSMASTPEIEASQPETLQSSELIEETQTSEPPEEIQTSEPLEETQTSEPPEETQTSEPPEETQTSEPPEETQTSEPPEEIQTSEPPEEIQTSEPPEETQTSEPPEEAQISASQEDVVSSSDAPNEEAKAGPEPQPLREEPPPEEPPCLTHDDGAAHGKPESMFKEPLETADQSDGEDSELKVQMGGNLLENLTMEELAAMVEDGKLREHHMVARQFSKNWIEASKVPALRPIFNRMRMQSEQQIIIPPPPVLKLPKRGIFSSLFGRN